MIRSAQKGQILLLVTFSLAAMIGMLSLAADLGWAYYLKRSAQKAADAAALAAAYRVFVASGEDPEIRCGTEIVCQDVAPCSDQVSSVPSNNVESGCLYAQKNGYVTGGRGGRQKVLIASGQTSPPPTAPGVFTHYWNTVTIQEATPLFWSSVLGGGLNLSARATAAIVDADMTASLVLLNRENECIPMESQAQLTCGVNLLVSANNNGGADALLAEGGIYLASNKHGVSGDRRYAGENSGGGTIRAPFTRIRGEGWYHNSNNGEWIETPVNRDSRGALDPMRGKGQPPPPVGLPNHEIPGGTITGSNDPNNPTILTPGNYYATAVGSDGVPYATGDPIKISGNVKFSSGGTGFGDYVVYGGFKNQSGGTSAIFDPGRYIFAGVRPKTNGDPNALFSISANMSLVDPNYANTSAPGEIFVFTDSNYVAQGRGLDIPALVRPIASELKQGNAGFQTGNNANVVTQLHGLNGDSPTLPSELKKFPNVLAWQDQANSIVKYDQTGNYVNCGSYICPNSTLASNKSPELFLQGSPNASMFGIIYQPRGSWTTVQGGGMYKVPVQLIAGSLKVQGSASFQMEKIPVPVTVRTVSLVE